ncbi:MAG: protein kinase [Pirellulales bacterium]
MTHWHPDKVQLSTFLSGSNLSLEDNSRIESHLETCAECRDYCLTQPACELEQRLSQIGTVDSSATESLVSHFELGEPLGRGGSGVVYRAHQPRLNRHIAVKMLIAGTQAHPQELARFRREAVSLAQLNHPSIVKILDSGELNGVPYLAMELIEGCTLSEQLSKGPLDFDIAARVTLLLSQAVQYAHQLNVLHRDLKPQNVLLQKLEGQDSHAKTALPGIPKLIDFGLARLGEASGLSQTKTGEVFGTPGYLAPELLSSACKASTTSIDIYGLGTILYECLTGRPPFQGSSFAEISRQILQDDPAPIRMLRPQVPADLETICMKCLAKSPTSRFQSAGELASDLQLYLNHEPISSRKPSLFERGVRWARKNTWRAAALAVLLVVAVAVPMGMLYHFGRLRTEATAAASNYKTTRESLWRVLDKVSATSGKNIPKLLELSLAQVEEAKELFKHLAQVDPSSQAKMDLAKAEMMAASLSLMLTREDQAESQLRSAIEILEAIELDPAWHDRASYNRSQALTRLAKRFMYKDGQQAEQYQQLSLHILEQLIQAEPNNSDYLSSLASAQHSHAAILQVLKKMESALEAYSLSIATRRKLETLSDPPNNNRQLLAGSFVNVGLIHYQAGNLQESESSYRTAYELLEADRIDRKEIQDDPAFMVDWTGLILNLATLVGNTNRVEESMELCSKAIQIAVPVLDREPNYGQLKNHLFMIVATRAQLHASQGEYIESSSDWDLSQQFVTDLGWKRMLPIHVAMDLARSERFSEAVELADRIRTNQEQWKALLPEERVHLVSVWAFASESSLNRAHEEDQNARQLAKRVLELTIELLEPIKAEINFKQQLQGQQWNAVKQLLDADDWKRIEQVAVR